MKTLLQLGLVTAILGALIVVANYTMRDTPKDTGGPVLVMKDLDQLRFTNDSDQDFGNCLVRIDGGFEAVLGSLPPRGRAALNRDAFGKIPRDEFYTRALRSMTMRCLDSNSNTVDVRLK
jgi:hypothetical protein